MRAHTFDFVHKYAAKLAHQVQSVLAKIELCRTKALGGHVYSCPSCDFELPVYNSCRDRHCPQCSAGRRAQWLEKTTPLLLPGVLYFQLVFTLPSQLRSFALGNRKSIFDLLMRAAWQALDELLRETLGVEPAAQMILHTWNQELDVHPHVHALVPGSFPSLDGQQWVTTRHPKHRRRRKPYLCDNIALGQRFRAKFIVGLTKLFRQGLLQFEHASSAKPVAFQAWLDELSEMDWNVFIQAPPANDSDPAQIAKYLARYMTGGPISDARLIAHANGEVVFWARSRDQHNRSRPFRLSGRQFVHQWSQHILPKGFTKSRAYGGYHNTKRTAYLPLCRDLLRPPIGQPTASAAAVAQPPSEGTRAHERTCPRCESMLIRRGEPTRIGWNEAFSGPDRPDWYYAFLGGHCQGFRWYRKGY